LAFVQNRHLFGQARRGPRRPALVHSGNSATHEPAGCAFRPGFLGAGGLRLLLLPSGAVPRARNLAGHRPPAPAPAPAADPAQATQPAPGTVFRRFARVALWLCVFCKLLFICELYTFFELILLVVFGAYVLQIKHKCSIFVTQNTKEMGTTIQPSGFQFSLITACADVYTSYDLPELRAVTGIILGIEYLYRSTFSGLYCYRVTFAQHFDQVLISDELQKIAEAFAKEVNRVEDWQEEVIEN